MHWLSRSMRGRTSHNSFWHSHLQCIQKVLYFFHILLCCSLMLKSFKSPQFLSISLLPFPFCCISISWKEELREGGTNTHSCAILSVFCLLRRNILRCGAGGQVEVVYLIGLLGPKKASWLSSLPSSTHEFMLFYAFHSIILTHVTLLFLTTILILMLFHIFEFSQLL